MSVPGNIPEPLRNAPLTLLSDTGQQMSFGERAALEGVLAQMRPDRAVEIGTAAGGSLKRIARHSRVVHAFDLAPPDERIVNLPNVRLHMGDSRDTLPRTLGRLRAHGGTVQFALIDGEHTTSGVHHDLTALLDSGCCERTVILCHDSAHPDVAAGITAAVTGSGNVVYHELRFLDGYTFAMGPFAGQLWGGLALIVTGDPASDGYPGIAGQSLYQR